MAERSKKLNILLIMGAALLVIALVLLVALQSQRLSGSQGIVLPEASTSQQAQTTPQTGLADVTRENVCDVLRTMARSTSYHQVFEIRTEAASHSRVQTAEVWVSGKIMRAQLEQDDEIRNILTDGQTLYIWYNGEMDAISLQQDSSVTADDLVGIPTYETILDIPAELITDASFVTLAEFNDLPCIFVSAIENGEECHYWVSLDTGLLCKQITVSDEQVIYALTQISVEQLAENDSNFADIFLLPDGTRPFATEE